MITIISLISGCENSDGLISFRVSHEGYFSNGETLIEKNGTTLECAKKCRKDVRCVAFSYQQSGECYHYHDPQALTTIQVNAMYKAYIKCNGRLVICILQHCIYQKNCFMVNIISSYSTFMLPYTYSRL